MINPQLLEAGYQRIRRKPTDKKVYKPAFFLGRSRVIESRHLGYKTPTSAQVYAEAILARWKRQYAAWLALPPDTQARLRPDLFPAVESVP